MNSLDIIYLIIFFILGLVFGSFYNVVGLRLCKKESLVFPSSHCPKCNHIIDGNPKFCPECGEKLK